MGNRKITYLAARQAIFTYLSSLPNWTCKRELKVPQVITPRGNVVFFKTEAVYLGSHSMMVDIRKFSPTTFAYLLTEMENGL